MAITDEALWEMEERFWTAPVEDVLPLIAPECRMVFAQTGALDRDFAVAGMRNAPRWQTVETSERHVERSGKDVAVLTYKATARRAEGEPTNVYCSSTYRGADAGWMMIQHQQTGID